MAGLVTDLVVAGRLLARATGRRLRGEIEAPEDLHAFRAGFDELLASLPEGVATDVAWLPFPANTPPWIDSRLHLQAGDEASYFVCGRTCVSRPLDIWVDPRIQVWSKIGPEGEIVSATRLSNTVRAAEPGKLLFGNYFPNEWADRKGNLQQSKDVYKSLKGDLLVLAIRWRASALEGLELLLAQGDYRGLVAGELERIRQGRIAPGGWEHLWNIGETEIYRPGRDPDGDESIDCSTDRDVGILQRDVSLPLTPETELSWRWCVDDLPSPLREDSVPSHDYLSLAVEFDNGRDITYFWSSKLSVGTGFDCPLPNWKGKEFHVVIRSGRDGLGQWQDERRNVFADYRQYMGEPPSRIVRVWLISVSIFQRYSGKCSYSNIAFRDDGNTTRIL